MSHCDQGSRIWKILMNVTDAYLRRYNLEENSHIAPILLGTNMLFFGRDGCLLLAFSSNRFLTRFLNWNCRMNQREMDFS